MFNFKRSIRLQLLVSFLLSFLTAVVVSYCIGQVLVHLFSITSINSRAVGFALIAVFFTISFFLLTSRKVKYIEELANGLMVISNGQLDYRVLERGHDELGSLGKYINEMAKDLQSKIEQERNIERAKNELITNVSHDLRTPLTSVVGYLRLLNDGGFHTQEQMRDYIRIAYNKSVQLQNLMEDLFEYTKLTSFEVRLRKQNVCMNDMVLQLTEEFLPLCEQNQLTLRAILPDERLFVDIDSDMFVRVLANLLSNAIKYSYKPSEIQIKVTANDNGVLIAVLNKGKTIPPEYLSRLFERFYRLDESRSAASGGSGLGLAVAKSIVDLHEGKLWAESANEQVSFHAWIPGV